MPTQVIPALAEFSLYIDKVSINKSTGQMQWSCVASDTDYDSYKQRMSLELFQDFIRRSAANLRPPAEFCSEAWSGGNPYLSVSHYYDLNGDGIAGDTRSIYIDGNRLKAKGTFRNTPLGLAAFQAICSDLYGRSEFSDKVRISIGFLDWSHSHGSYVFERKTIWDQCPMCRESRDDIVFLRGQLIHLAMTRVPVNKRTDIEPVMEERSMTTKKQDAASIVGEELAEELDEKEHVLVGKSEAFVEKSETPELEDADEGEAVETATVEESNPAEVAMEAVENKGDHRPLGGAKTFEELDEFQSMQEQAAQLQSNWYALQTMMYNIMEDEACTDKKKTMEKALAGFQNRLEMKALFALERLAEQPEIIQKSVQAPEPIPVHVLDAALSTFKSQYDAAVKEPEPLVVLQSAFQGLADAIRESIPAPATVEQSADAPAPTQDVAEAIKIALQPMVQQMQILTQQLSAVQLAKSVQTSTPQRRSVPAAQLMSAPASQEVTSQIDKLARRSVGIL